MASVLYFLGMVSGTIYGRITHDYLTWLVVALVLLSALRGRPKAAVVVTVLAMGLEYWMVTAANHHAGIAPIPLRFTLITYGIVWPLIAAMSYGVGTFIARSSARLRKA